MRVGALYANALEPSRIIFLLFHIFLVLTTLVVFILQITEPRGGSYHMFHARTLIGMSMIEFLRG